MTARRIPILFAVLFAARFPLAASAQNPVKPGNDVTDAIKLGVPVDPSTLVDQATMPRDLGRRALEALGLTADGLSGAPSTSYSATHLEDVSGRLEVFFASVVKRHDRWVFWAPDTPNDIARGASEIQLTLATQKGARYLVDFALDSAEQRFALVCGGTRTTQAPGLGHLALVVTASGKETGVRVVPLGDDRNKSRHFTLFAATVTKIP